MTGVAVGTPSYMSPEQCAAKEVTGQSDQYSLGIVAYEMLTGKQPFVADTAMAIMWQHFNDPPPPITDSRSDCPKEVEAIVLRMLAKQPDGRYPSIDEVVGAIGAPPLTHDDPTRLKMVELAKTSLNQRLLDEMKTPTSLVPPSRDSGKRTTVVSGVGSVAVSPRSAALAVGETVQLAAFLQDTEGKTLADRKVEWASTAPQVATISTAGLVTAVGPGEVMITASCEGHVGTSTLTISPASVASVVLAPSTISLEAGATVQLTATARDASGRALADREAAWSSSAPRTASVSAGGVVTGAAPGSAKITVTVEKKSASATVTVTAIPVAAVELSPGSLALHVGATSRLSATVKDARGQALADRPVTWASRAPAVVRVADGLVTAVAPGEGEITATCEGASATARVAISPVPVARVVPSEQSLALDAGQAVRLAAKVLAADGTALEGRKVTWESGDSKTVTITPAGEVTGVESGSAAVTVSCEGKSATVAVKVSPVAVSSVQLSPPSLALEVGRTARFTSLARDARGHELSGRDASWTSSKPAIARVSSDGEVTGLAAGFSVVTATVEGRKATGEVKVTAPVVADAGPEARTVKVPGVARVTEPVAVREAEPARAQSREVPVPEMRKSRAPLIVVIALLAVAGVAAAVFLRPKPVGPGGTTAVSGGDLPAGSVALVAVAPATATVSVGDSVALLPTFLDSAGTRVQGGTVQWTSDNPAVATVSDGGVVRGMSGGNATIIVSAGEVRGVASVTVQGAAAADHVPIASIAIPSPPASLPVGESVELTVAMKDKDGGALAGRPVIWTSSAPRVATITPAGIVTGVGAGTVTVTASSEGRSARVTLKVEPAAVASVAVTPSRSSIAVGGTVQLAAAVHDARGNALDGRAVSWTSSAPQVAGVSSSGLVTGTAVGTATITAESEGKSNTATVAIVSNRVDVAAVAVTPGSRELQPGETVQLQAELKDARGQAITDRTPAWSSSDEQVVTVSPSGLVSAVGPGTATVSATSDQKSAGARITVARAAVAAVAVTSPPASLPVGESAQLNATLRDTRGGVLSDRQVRWSSDDERVATVSQSGTVTAVGPGATRITVTSENRSASVTVRVPVPAPVVAVVAVASVAVSAPGSTLEVGQTMQLTAGVRDDRGNAVTDRPLSWSSSATGVATVSRTGQVTAVGAGTATITATAESKSGTVALTVTAPAGPGPVVTGGGGRAGAVPRVSLAAGGQHTCGLLPGGGVACWGDGVLDPSAITASVTLVKLSSGDGHTCGLTGGGEAWCWGNNAHGQLGNRTRRDSPTDPVQVVGGLAFRMLSTGGRHTCGLTSAGRAYCWGDNRNGQLGDGSQTRANRTGPGAGPDLPGDLGGRWPHLRAHHHRQGLLLGRRIQRPARLWRVVGGTVAGRSEHRREVRPCLRGGWLQLRADGGGQGLLLGRQPQRPAGRRLDQRPQDAGAGPVDAHLRRTGPGAGACLRAYRRPGVLLGRQSPRPAGQRDPPVSQSTGRRYLRRVLHFRLGGGESTPAPPRPPGPSVGG